MGNECQQIFSTKLREKLIRKVKGGVYVRILDDDRLYVNIRRNDGFEFTMYIDRISKRILHGYSTDNAFAEIIGKLKEDIMREYFYH